MAELLSKILTPYSVQLINGCSDGKCGRRYEITYNLAVVPMTPVFRNPKEAHELESLLNEAFRRGVEAGKLGQA